ncbi:MAG TPA: hypothetical protein VMF53_10085 [Alphaproteobacteria bacterium]|nr:hypothetical protein [Alphaproteobacteria bacterium]
MGRHSVFTAILTDAGVAMRSTVLPTFFGAAVLIAFSASAVAQEIGELEVQAAQSWRDTYIDVNAPGVLRFHAVGTWVFNPSRPAVDADGDRRLPTGGRACYADQDPNAREGQLIGRIGNGRPFVVGASSERRVGDERGRLFLVINDDLGRCYGSGLTDNSGALKVRIDYAW